MRDGVRRQDGEEEEEEEEPETEDQEDVQHAIETGQRELYEAQTRRQTRPETGYHHPLFPLENDAPARKTPFVWIHLSRLRDDGSETVESHPQRWPAGQL